MKNYSFRPFVLAAALTAARLFPLPLAHADDAPPPHAPHILIVVMDGLRPDSVTPTQMPTLYALSQRGVTFTHHHPVYFSSTEVNGTAIATGSYPQHDGIMANTEYRPAIDSLGGVAMEKTSTVRKGDLVSNGHYIAEPTLADLLLANNMQTVVAGTKPVALLLNRSARPDSSASITLFKGESLPSAIGAQAAATAAEGAFPKIADPKKSANAQQDKWTTRVLVKRIWPHGVPALTLLWLSEPDFAQHGSGPGSPVALTALKSDDDNLAYVLHSLDEQNLTNQTDIFVVSDHGFSTVSHIVDLADELTSAGLPAFDKFNAPPTPGTILVVGNGGSTCIYVTGHDPAVIQKAVTVLQTLPCTGVLFTRNALPGTFPLDQARIDTPDAPDIVISMHWDDATVYPNTPGTIYSEGAKKLPGQGNHTSLSRFDMHNTLIAAGPDIKTNFADPLPSGNPDLAPTILYLLNIPNPPKLDGRILTEALTSTTPIPPPPQQQTITASTALTTPLTTGLWRQYIKITSYAGATYVDEGNGIFTPNP